MAVDGPLDDLAITRRLARDQWVRLLGTPRVTVLAGGRRARERWHAWLELGAMTGVLAEGDSVGDAMTRAIQHVLAHPHDPVAVLASPARLRAWRESRSDRDAALFDEGWLLVPEVETPAQAERPTPALHLDARSAAEAALFDALEATPATAGRFVLNDTLSVRFGARAAEIDLLSRADAIAIEVDGIHHFADPDCYRRDRRKDLLMQTHGYLVVRVLAEDVLRDARDAVNHVLAALAYRRAEAAR